MNRRSTMWRVMSVVVVLFLFVNLGGAVYAAVQGEVVHTGVHAGLLVAAAYLVWRVAARRAPV